MELDKLQPARYTSITYENGTGLLQEDPRGRERGQALLPRGMERGGEAALRSGHLQGGRDDDDREPAFPRSTAVRRAGFVGAGSRILRDPDPGRRPRNAPSRKHLPVLRPVRLDAGQQVPLLRRREGDRHQEPRHRAEPQDEAAQGRDRASSRTSTSSATKATRSWESQPKEFPSASIDESYPDYIVGSLFTVQNEMRIFYAPISGLKSRKIKWKVLCKPSDNLVRGMAFHKDQVYAVTHANAPHYKVVRTSVKHPDWAHAETVVPGSEGLHPVHREEQGLPVRRLLQRGRGPHRQVRPRNGEDERGRASRPRASFRIINVRTGARIGASCT